MIKDIIKKATPKDIHMFMVCCSIAVILIGLGVFISLVFRGKAELHFARAEELREEAIKLELANDKTAGSNKVFKCVPNLNDDIIIGQFPGDLDTSGGPCGTTECPRLDH